MVIDGHVLIIDQGGHSSRALVFDHRGELLAASSCEVSTEFSDHGQVEQNPSELLESIHHCLQQLAEKLDKATLLQIKVAGLIVQRSSLLACDAQGQPITAVLSWQDTRNQPWLEQQHLDIRHIHQLTGLRANAHYGASKMRWLLDNDAGVQAAAKSGQLQFAPLSAWLAQQLTAADNLVVDAVIAQRTLLTNRQHEWDTRLLKWFGITRQQLPDIVSSDYPIGDIVMADQTVPLMLVGGDQSFLPLAYGRQALGNSAFINIGTGAFVQAALPMQQVPEGLLASPIAVTGQAAMSIAEGTVNAAASALDWVWQQQGKPQNYAQLEAVLTDQVLNQYTSMVFINTLAGTGSPYWLAQKAPVFIGEGDEATQLLAVAESILFALQDNLQLIRSARGTLQRIIVSGGLARSAGLCQKLANLSGLTVIRPKDHEASARGAAVFLLDQEPHDLLVSADRFYAKEDAPMQSRYRQYQQSISERC